MDATVPEARTLLARAFANDPLMVWFFPDDESRLQACAALFGLFAEHYLAVGRVDVRRRDHLAGVAMCSSRTPNLPTHRSRCRPRPA